MDIREILRRLREKHSDRRIARDMNINRRTVQRYREWAIAENLLTGDLPDRQTLASKLPGEQIPPQNVSSAEAYQEKIEQWLAENVDVSAMHLRMREQGYSGSYSSVLRLARRLDPKKTEAVGRSECQPGEEAQIDFGYVGLMLDGDPNNPGAGEMVILFIDSLKCTVGSLIFKGVFKNHIDFALLWVKFLIKSYHFVSLWIHRRVTCLKAGYSHQNLADFRLSVGQKFQKLVFEISQPRDISLVFLFY